MKNKTLTLSIIIPVYNEADYLEACLDSIAAQTTKPDEVIVVDNNSTDRTPEIARGYSFVRLLKESKQGVVFARNKGFDAAKSRIIARIDADTLLPEDWVEKAGKLYAEAGSKKYYAVTAPSTFRNHGGHPLFYALHRVTYFWPAKLMLGHATLVGSNMFLTRDLWLKVRSSTCVRTDMHEDMDLAFHIGKTGTPIEFSPSLKASVVARKMFTRIYSYPMMMIKIRLGSHRELRTSY